MCQFSLINQEFYYTNAIFDNNTIKCLSPLLNDMAVSVYDVILSIFHVKTNITFGYYYLKLINCSNFLSCSSCTLYSNLCSWNYEKFRCISSENRNELSITNSQQCSRLYLQQSIEYLSSNINKTFEIHIEQCDESININSCQLHDHHKRFLIKTSNPILFRSKREKTYCLLKCLFQENDFQQIKFYRQINLQLSIEYLNKTKTIIPNTNISLYHCEHLASNCTSCSQLNPLFNCIWCNNRCSFKNQSIKCLNNHQCLSPVIENIEPMILPINGGTIVTIKGKYFDLYQLSSYIGNIPCQLIEEESSNNR